MIVHYSLYKYVNIYFTVGENCKVHIMQYILYSEMIIPYYIINKLQKT